MVPPSPEDPRAPVGGRRSRPDEWSLGADQPNTLLNRRNATVRSGGARKLSFHRTAGCGIWTSLPCTESLDEDDPRWARSLSLSLAIRNTLSSYPTGGGFVSHILRPRFGAIIPE